MDLNSLASSYTSCKQAEDAVKGCASQAGYFLKRARSKNDRQKRLHKVWLACAHGGVHKPKDNPIRKTTSRLLNCPWSAKIKRQGVEQDACKWVIEVTNNTHNHEPSNNLAEIPAARSLTTDQLDQVIEMTKEGAPPRAIIKTLKASDPSNRTIAQDLYNIRKKRRTDFLRGRPPLEALFDSLRQDDVYHTFERDSDGQLLRLFIAPKSSVFAANAFCTTDVLLIESTDRFNSYQMPLLHIMGITSTHQSLSLCYCFMQDESEYDFAWALCQLKSCFALNLCERCVVFTEQKWGLMHAMSHVLPQAINLISMWHIHKDILSNVKPFFATDHEWQRFVTEWRNLCSSETSEEFVERFGTIQMHTTANIFEYMNSTWIVHKEKFIPAWTRHILHFGHLETFQVEGGHTAFKQWISMPTDNSARVYKQLLLASQQQRDRIADGMLYDRSHNLLQIEGPFWQAVLRRISHYALEQVFEQFHKAFLLDRNSRCTRSFINSKGLPCAHFINDLLASNMTLAIEHFDPHWHLDKVSFTSIDHLVPDLDRFCSSEHTVDLPVLTASEAPFLCYVPEGI